MDVPNKIIGVVDTAAKMITNKGGDNILGVYGRELHVDRRRRVQGDLEERYMEGNKVTI